MSFKDNLNDDAVNTILDTGVFAEEITYTPKGGSEKTIKAIVIRSRLGTSGEDSGKILLNQAEVFIAYEDTYGVNNVIKGADTVSFPERIGGIDVTWKVMDVIDQDNGMWHLLVQK